MNLISIGLFFIFLAFGILIYTSNLFFSKVEKELAELYFECIKDGLVPTPEMKFSRLNLMVVYACRCLFILGMFLIISGFFSLIIKGV